MTLADTLVWIDHLRRGAHTLGELLEDNQVLPLGVLAPFGEKFGLS